MNDVLQPPDYARGNLVNLMSSLARGLGVAHDYPALDALPPAAVGARRNVVLLVIDGLGAAYLQERPDSFLARHTSATLSSVFPSTTASAVTTLLTGLAPQQHGLSGWFTWLQELGSVAAILPFRPRHGGAPYSRSGVDPRLIFDWSALFDRVGGASYVVSASYISESDYSLATGGRAQRHAYEDLAGLFAHIRAIVASHDERKYVYAYWPKFDALAHEFGIASAEVAAQFTAIDTGVRTLFEALKGSDTLLLVCADHGLIDTGPEFTLHLADHPRLGACLTLPLCGEPRAAYCYVHPRKRAEFSAYVQGELATQCALIASEELLAQGYFGHGAAHPRLAARIGDYALLMRERYVIKDRLANETAFAQIGVHGGTSRAEMQVPLLVLDARG